MNRIFAFLVLAATALGTWAMTEAEQERTVWNALDEILIEQEGAPALNILKRDIDNDGVDDLVLSTGNKVARPQYRAYSVGRNMAPIAMTDALRQMVQGNEYPNNWHPIQYITSLWSVPGDDITMSQVPIFISAMEMAKNDFMGWREGWNRPGAEYTHMVFKPHVNEIRFVRDNRISTSLDGDTLWQNVREFKLKDPKVVSKMFRGYTDGNAVPVAVTRQFLTTHQPQQFSRWLSPEPIRTMPQAVQQIVLDYYGPGYRVERSQWLATLPTQVGNRVYYQVLLASPQKVLFAVVCIAEGGVASTVEMLYDEKEGDATFSADLSDVDILGAGVEDLFAEHMPSISCIMLTDRGIELYVEWASMEGTHYSIWREVGCHMVNIIDEYHYWMFG